MAKEAEEKNEEEYDLISEAIGEYGRWQCYLTFFLSLFNIPCTWHIFAPTFHAVERESWCARTPEYANLDPRLWKNYTQPYGECSIIDFKSLSSNLSLSHIDPHGVKYTQCTEWEFGEGGSTLISEFSLTCDRKQLNNIAEMMFLAGVAVGGLICGVISDRYGRKKTLMASLLLQTILGTMIAFVPWFEMYVILRAALGFISVSVVFSGFVLSIELVGGVWRTVAGLSYLFPVSLSYMTIAGIAWLLRDWRHLQIAISLPGGLLLILWWILPESPRWLHAMGRTDELMMVLQNAAAVNKRDLPHNIDKKLLPSVNTRTESVGVMDLFKTKRMLKNTILLFVIWFVVYLVYYGLVLNLANIGGDLYLNSVLSGAVEIPAVAFSIIILLRMGRRWPLALTMILAGVACLFTLTIPDNVQWLTTFLTMAGKFSISSSNAVIPVFTAELYPTTIRNIGVGASNVSAGIALLLVPYLWEMAAIHTYVPMAILGICGGIGGISVLFLPETGNEPLKKTIGEENLESRSSITEDNKRVTSNVA